MVGSRPASERDPGENTNDYDYIYRGEAYDTLFDMLKMQYFDITNPDNSPQLPPRPSEITLDSILEKLNIIITANTYHHPALNLRGDIYTKQRLYLLAIQDYKLAISIQPHIAHYHDSLGKAHYYLSLRHKREERELAATLSSATNLTSSSKSMPSDDLPKGSSAMHLDLAIDAYSQAIIIAEANCLESLGTAYLNRYMAYYRKGLMELACSDRANSLIANWKHNHEPIITNILGINITNIKISMLQRCLDPNTELGIILKTLPSEEYMSTRRLAMQELQAMGILPKAAPAKANKATSIFSIFGHKKSETAEHQHAAAQVFLQAVESSAAKLAIPAATTEIKRENSDSSPPPSLRRGPGSQ